MSELTLTQRYVPGVSVVVVDGDLDLRTADRLESFVRQACRPGDRLIVDLTATAFMDCRGLRALLGTHPGWRRDGERLHVVGLHSGPARLIHVTGSDRCVVMHTDLDDALRAVTAGRDVATAAPDGGASG